MAMLRYLAAASALLTVGLGGGCSDDPARPHPPPGDSVPSPDTTQPVSRRPDIVLILTDDQRNATMAYMPRTMALIGAPGVSFSNAFASTPLCCPSRASILTGLFTHNHGVLTNGPPLGGAQRFIDTATVAVWLQRAGYRTGLIGKYLNGYLKLQPWPYRPPGWSRWVTFKDVEYYDYILVEDSLEVVHGASAADYSTDVLTAHALQFISETPDSQPLFLYFAPKAPHTPAIPAPQDVGSFSWLPPWRPPSYGELDVSDKPAWVKALPLGGSAASDSDAFVEAQVEALQAVDRAVEQIVQRLQAAGRLDRTLIIFASDNGLAWGEHRWFNKNCLYEECIRIPLMIRGPGIAPRQDTHLVELVDLAPTIVHWADIAPPARFDGRDLVPLLQDSTTSWRTAILLEVMARSSPGDEALFSAVRTDRYVYAELTTGERELYDLELDPFQLNNIAADPTNASLIVSLQALLAPLQTQ